MRVTSRSFVGAWQYVHGMLLNPSRKDSSALASASIQHNAGLSSRLSGAALSYVTCDDVAFDASPNGPGLAAKVLHTVSSRSLANSTH